MPTAMALAFSSARVTPATSPALVDTCLKALSRNLKGRPQKGWKANLSYRTYKSLANKGVIQ